MWHVERIEKFIIVWCYIYICHVEITSVDEVISNQLSIKHTF